MNTGPMVEVVLKYDEDIVGTRLYVLQEIDGKMYLAKPTEFVFEEYSMESYPTPTMSFDRRTGERFLSQLANALVKIGFRADELKAKDSEITAVKYHLEDMRKLVFSKGV